MPATTSEAELRRLAAEGLSWPEVAKKLGMNVMLIRRVACALGVKGGLQRNPRDPEPWVQELANGVPKSVIATREGMSRKGVYNTLYYRGLPTDQAEAVRYLASRQ